MRETEAERITAFQRLADDRLDASYALATAIMRSDHDAQDAVHVAVVIAWKRWASLRDRARFDAWFDRIVVNVCRDRLRWEGPMRCVLTTLMDGPCFYALTGKGAYEGLSATLAMTESIDGEAENDYIEIYRLAGLIFLGNPRRKPGPRRCASGHRPAIS